MIPNVPNFFDVHVLIQILHLYMYTYDVLCLCNYNVYIHIIYFSQDFPLQVRKSTQI